VKDTPVRPKNRFLVFGSPAIEHAFCREQEAILTK